MRSHILSLLILAVPNLVFATNIDSLRNLLNQKLPDTSKFIIYDELFWSTVYSFPAKAKDLADTCIIIADQIGRNKYKLMGLRNLGSAHILLNQADSAIHHLDIGIKMAENNCCETLLYDLYGAQGNAYILLNEYEKAQATLNKVVQKHKLNKDSSSTLVSLTNLGALKTKMGQNEEAISYFLEAINYVENHGSLHKRGIIHMNIGVLYANVEDKQSALTHFFKAEKIFSSLNNEIHKVTIYNNLGEHYFQMKNYDEAKKWFLKSLNINESHIIGLAFSNLGLSQIYNHTDRNELALQYALKALEYDKQANNKIEIAVDHSHIAKVLANLGRYEEALRHYSKAETLNADFPISQNKVNIKVNKISALVKKHKLTMIEKEIEALFSLQDSLDLITQRKTIKNIEARYENQQKKDSLMLLSANEIILNNEIKIQQNQNLVLLLVLAFVLFTLSILAYFYKDKQHKNKLLTDQKSKIETLHKELSHRVKNNLSFISSLMRMQLRRLEHPEAKEAILESENRIQAMSSIHRRLYQDESTNVNMREYLEEICLHLKNIFAKHNEEVKFNIETNEIEMEPETTMRIGLIINELVTNSFKHSVNNQNRVSIKINLQEKDAGNYYLSYSDNGQGITSNIRVQQSGTVGLQLINDLTEQLNGRFEIETKKGTRFNFSFKGQKVAG